MATDNTEDLKSKILAELIRITQVEGLHGRMIKQNQGVPEFRCNIGALRTNDPNSIIDNWKLPDIDIEYNKTRKNFVFRYDAAETGILLNVLREIVRYGSDPELPEWGHMTSEMQSEPRTVVIESSSPNIAKPFHMGHLRSTILGNYIGNLYRALGHKVVAVNYLGDWGKQYGLLAVAWKKWGNEEELQRDPIHHLCDLYVRIREELTIEQDWDPDAPSEINDVARAYFAAMEQGDPEKLATWKKFRDLSVTALEKTYSRLGITYDVYSGEERAAHDPEGEEVIQALVRNGMVDYGTTSTTEETSSSSTGDGDTNAAAAAAGCILVAFERSPTVNDRKLQPALLRKTDGSTLYMTRDLAEIFSRDNNYAADNYLYVVGDTQSLHFRQLTAIVRLLDPILADKVKHIGFGLVQGDSGKMATRNGTSVYLEDVLDEAQSRMLHKMEENREKYANVIDPLYTAEKLGQSAVIIQDLLGSRLRNYVFDWNKSCANRGLTGPYLQYAHARICNIFQKTGMSIDSDTPPPYAADLLEDESCWKSTGGDQTIETFMNVRVDETSSETISCGKMDLWRNVIRSISQYHKILQSCLKSHESAPLVDFLMKLAKSVSEIYKDFPVKTLVECPDHDVKKIGYRNALIFWCARLVLASGMKLLGLQPIANM